MNIIKQSNKLKLIEQLALIRLMERVSPEQVNGDGAVEPRATLGMTDPDFAKHASQEIGLRITEANIFNTRKVLKIPHYDPPPKERQSSPNGTLYQRVAKLEDTVRDGLLSSALSAPSATNNEQRISDLEGAMSAQALLIEQQAKEQIGMLSLFDSIKEQVSRLERLVASKIAIIEAIEDGPSRDRLAAIVKGEKR